MQALFIYIAKSSSLLLLFYCAYYFLLRKETFFNSNRWFLLSGLIISAALPFLVYKKIVWIDAAPLNINLPSTFSHTAVNESFEFHWYYVILTLYSLGLLVFIIKLAIDFYSLHSIIKGKKIQQQADFKFIDVKENIAPFSYFEYIVYNSSLYTASELENIIEHEKVHSDQNHTIDVLISRFFSIIFWFNPLVWLYKKALTQNLEFIADSEAAKKLIDKKAYQYTLLKITTHENCVAITNHFYQSLIKKRIVMLNKNQSKRSNSWKYYAVIPALIAFVLLFQIEVIAKERQQIVKGISEKIKSVDVYKIRKSSTDADLKEIKEKLKSIHNIDFNVSGIKRDSENNLTSIIVSVKNGNQQSQSIQTEGNTTIKDFGVVVTTDDNGSKKVGIQTSEETTDAQTIKEPKIATSKKLTTKIKNDVNTDPTINTKTISNTNTTTSTTVETNTQTGTKVFTNNEGGTITFSNSVKSKKVQGFPLVIVNGEEMPESFDYEVIDPKDIKSVNILKGEMSITKYGEKGKNGVMIIETSK